MLLGAAWLLYAAFFAPAGLFTDDEIIYSAMIDRFATAGSFVIPNGYEDFPTQSLRLTFLVPGPHGLVPQYPVGYAILAAPFYLLGGLQGVIFLNALASVLTLFLTYRIAQVLFKEDRLAISAALVFGFATFAVDYAFAIWPHATANLLVAGALYGAVLGLDDEERNWKWVALAGLLIGLGLTIRRDVLVAAPLIGAWLFIFSRRPVRMTVGFVVPLGLGLLAAGWLNYLKFGVFNPVTYGHAAGDGQMQGVLRYLPYALFAGVVLLLMRWRLLWRALSGKWGWGVLLLGTLVIVLVPAFRNLAMRIIDGLWVLLVDLEHLRDLATNSRYEQVGDSHYLYFGTLKKTLVESLPFLPLLVFPLAGIFRGSRKAAYVLCFFFPLCWFLVYAPTQLIGGLANNMRYLAPALPLLAIVGALAWRQVSTDSKPGIYVIVGLSGILAVGLMSLAAWTNEYLGVLEAFFVGGGARWFGLALLVLAAAWLLFAGARRALSPPLQVMMMTSFLLAMMAAYPFDAYRTREVRAAVQEGSERLRYIELDAHVFAPGYFALYFQLQREAGTLAFYVPEEIDLDLELMKRALDQGRPVYIASVELTRIVRKAMREQGWKTGPGGYGIKRSVSPADGRHYGLYELTRDG